MTEYTEREIQRILKRAMPPVEDGELKRDLWPMALSRLDQSQSAPGWLDWGLIGLVAIVLAAVPQIFPVLLYFL